MPDRPSGNASLRSEFSTRRAAPARSSFIRSSASPTSIPPPGDLRPIAEIRRAVCTASIFGVDVNPTAVWLCELRLWLSVVIEHEEEDPFSGCPPLPNLDHNIRVGDTLAVPPAFAPLTYHSWGGAPWGLTRTPSTDRPATGRAALPPLPVTPTPSPHRTATLRARYAALSGPRKLAAARRLDTAERAHALATLDRTLAPPPPRPRRSPPSPARPRPLRHASTPRSHCHRSARHTPHRPPGNGPPPHRPRQRGSPPVRFSPGTSPMWQASTGLTLCSETRPGCALMRSPRDTRDALRTHYASARNAPWAAGATLARAGQGFAAQTDLAAPFTERALALTRPHGVPRLPPPRQTLAHPQRRWPARAPYRSRRRAHPRRLVRRPGRLRRGHLPLPPGRPPPPLPHVPHLRRSAPASTPAAVTFDPDPARPTGPGEPLAHSPAGRPPRLQRTPNRRPPARRYHPSPALPWASSLATTPPSSSTSITSTAPTL